MRRRLLSLWLLASLPMIAAVTWWLIGDVSEPGLLAPDHVVHPPRMSPSAEIALGGVAAFMVTIIFIVLLLAQRRGVIVARQLAAMIPLGALGAFAGFTFRVVTAGVSGANTGAGLLMIASVVIVPALLTMAHLLWRSAPFEHR